MTKAKGRSRLQKANSIAQIAQLKASKASNQENCAPVGSGLADSLPAGEIFVTKAELSRQQECSNDYEQCFHNS
jgi:hypothetical protein